MDLISKYELIEKIVGTEDETVLSQIKHLLEENEIESWDVIPEPLKKSIQRGITQSNKGQVTPNNKVMKELRKKYIK